MMVHLKFVLNLSAAALTSVLLGCGGGSSGGGGGSGGGSAPASPALPTLSFIPTKQFRFTWSDVSDATFYRLQENPDGVSGFSQLGSDIVAGAQAINISVALFRRVNAQYILQSCNANGCTDSNTLTVSGSLATSVGYFKAANTGSMDQFGSVVALSSDGSTLAIGAQSEDSNATVITNGSGSSGTDAGTDNSGAVYVFSRTGNDWAQQAYIKASNAEADDSFGTSITLSNDGNTLVVGAVGEDSDGTSAIDNNATAAGAVYVYVRNGSTWSEQAYIKAVNAGANDQFGFASSLSGDENTLAVGALGEDSNSQAVTNGTGSAGTDSGADESGAVYIYVRSGNAWSQQAYIKASNAGISDFFGSTLSVSGDGNSLAVGAEEEDGNGSSPANNGPANSGAVYIFTRSGTAWSEQRYLKAVNIGNEDRFDSVVSLDNSGSTLAVGAPREDSAATGVINGTTSPVAADVSTTENHGAVYVYTGGGASWTQQAYIKPLVTSTEDTFGVPVSLSADGNTLAVGASGTMAAEGEDSGSNGLSGNAADGSASNSGAAYIFTRTGGNWAQTAFVKANNSDAEDRFGSLDISDDGDTLAVGARLEDGGETGINNNELSNALADSGAAYLY